MAKIFLSYRRQDSAGVAGRIYDRLRAHFGADALFMDVDSIDFGSDFRVHIRSAVDQCSVVLAVIGPDWAGETGAGRRIDDPRDFVRIEIEAALARDIPVIPILVDHATMSGETDLPPSLALLAYRNAIDVDQGRDFHNHVDRLIRGIERALTPPDLSTTTPPRRPEKPAAVIPPPREHAPGRPAAVIPPPRGHALGLAIIFAILALMAGFFGFAGLAGEAARVAKVMMFAFLVLFVVTLFLGRRTTPAA